MKRLVLGSVLLAATALTGVLFGSTGESRVRVLNARPPVTDAPVSRTRSVAVPVPAPGPVVSTPAPPAAPPAEAPAASERVARGSTGDLVDRMRRHLPRLGDDAAERIRRYHAGYKKELRERTWAVTSALLEDPESRRRAVEAMREFRREREEFLRNVLGRRDYESWKSIERTGGRDLDQLVRRITAQGR